MKRFLALIVAIALFAAVIPTGASAATQQELYKKINADYQSALAATGKESLGGFCGLMTSWQLYLIGINQYLIGADGNRQFDTYCDLEYTTGGYKVRAYPARDYTLLEALQHISENGTRDVYNILVGFEWTNTEAGAQYGHAVVIYAIIDGMVYFTEGYQTSFGSGDGQATSLSIADFVRYYHDWTTYEGLIYFGQRDQKFSCTRYPANAFARAKESAPVHSQPCELTCDGSDVELLRTAAAGERFWVTGVYETKEGAFYYEVQELDGCAYIPAQLLTVEEADFSDASLENAKLPSKLKLKEQFSLDGTVTGGNSEVSAVRVTVKDHSAKQQLQYTADKTDGSFSLSGYASRKALNFAQLAQGCYSLGIYADMKSYEVKDGKLACREETVCILQTDFIVGEVAQLPQRMAQTPDIKDGWELENGSFYYYKNGAVQTGWILDDGVRYYLDSTGRAVTGWRYIRGSRHLFTKTGALCTGGWVQTQGGTCYFSQSGVSYGGWQLIDGKKHYFDMHGYLVRSDWATWEGKTYYLLQDGTPITGGWHTVDARRCFFRNDGSLRTELVQVGDNTYLKNDASSLTVSCLLDAEK